jgi:hypothetical protein
VDATSIGRVIDALTAVAKAPANADLFADVTVTDGPWPESDEPDNLVMIGLTAQGDAESGGTMTPRTLGGSYGQIQEDYGLVCQIRCWTGSAAATAQKTVRDKALGLFDFYKDLVHADSTIGRQYVPPTSGQLPTMWAEQNGLTQTDADVETGRIAIVQFTIHVSNSLNS